MERNASHGHLNRPTVIRALLETIQMPVLTRTIVVILMGSHVHGVTLLIRASVGSIVMFKFVSSEDMVVSEDIIPHT